MTKPYIQFTRKTSTEYVPLHFQMNPATDDLLFSGDDLRRGMVVLVADPILRGDPSRIDSDSEFSAYEKSRCDRTNRWAEVLRIGRMGHDIIKIMVKYADGAKDVHTYNVSYAWYVKKESIPSDYVATLPTLVKEIPLADWERDLLTRPGE